MSISFCNAVLSDMLCWLPRGATSRESVAATCPIRLPCMNQTEPDGPNRASN